MTHHRFFARLHVGLLTLIATAGTRLRTAPQGGQGTVEYVALILLVAGVMAAAVGAAAKSGNFDKVIADEIKQAVTKVSK